MKIPKHLKHKPLAIIDDENFTELDGRYANNTDLQGISLGRAQWDDKTLSVKTCRHTGKRWSRMSEELPMSRVVDLMLLIAKVKSNIDGLKNVLLIMS